MARQITLKSYSIEKRQKTEPDSYILSILEDKAQGDLLIFGEDVILEADFFQKKGHKVIFIDPDFSTLKNAKFTNPGINLIHLDFFNLRKVHPENRFDYIVEIGYSDRLVQDNWQRFYDEIAKILKPKGMLFSHVLSSNDSYCLEHCPRRGWTFINDRYRRFLRKEDLSSAMKSNFFRILEHREVKKDTGTYHLLSAVQTLPRL